MPKSRVYPSVLSLKLHIFVIGGYSPSYTVAVEIFKLDVSQWFKADPLPKACCDISSVAIDDVIYSLGGYKHPLHLSQAVCAPISDLLHSAVSADDSVESEISFTKSVWKKLHNTPTYEPAAAVLGGKLLAIGGTDKATKGENRKEVYMFAELANLWTYIGDLPSGVATPGPTRAQAQDKLAYALVKLIANLRIKYLNCKAKTSGSC